MAAMGTARDIEAESEAEEKGERGPGIVPLFYKLSVEECKDGNLCKRYGEVFQRHEFFEESRLLKCSEGEMLEAVSKLTEYSGEGKRKVETAEMYVARAVIRVCGSVLLGSF